MRYIFLLLLPILGYSQTDSLLTFTAVEQVPGVSKADLFTRARTWVNESFRSSKAVLEIVDKETGELSGKGIIEAPYYFRYMGAKNKLYTRYNFRFSIYLKDGRYKYEFTEFRFEKDSKTGFGDEYVTTANECPYKLAMYSKKNKDFMWQSIQEGLSGVVVPFIESLKISMAKANQKTDF